MESQNIVWSAKITDRAKQRLTMLPSKRFNSPNQKFTHPRTNIGSTITAGKQIKLKFLCFANYIFD